jgi:hypothetical protein
MNEQLMQAAARAANATSQPLLAMVKILEAVPKAVELILIASDVRSVGLVVEAARAELAEQKAVVDDDQ